MRRTIALLGLVLIAAACTPDDQETGSISADDVRQAREQLPAALQMRLDSGNAAYRRGDYLAARQQYRAAVAEDQEQAAPWFGLYMANRALGDSAAARQALETAQSLAPGATLIHPDNAEPTSDMQSPHPQIPAQPRDGGR